MVETANDSSCLLVGRKKKKRKEGIFSVNIDSLTGGDGEVVSMNMSLFFFGDRLENCFSCG